MKLVKQPISVRRNIYPKQSLAFWNIQKTRLYSFPLILLVQLAYYRIFCEFQQQLFGTCILEVHRSLSILTTTLYLYNSTDAKALVLNDVTLLQSNITDR